MNARSVGIGIDPPLRSRTRGRVDGNAFLSNEGTGREQECQAKDSANFFTHTIIPRLETTIAIERTNANTQFKALPKRRYRALLMAFVSDRPRNSKPREEVQRNRGEAFSLFLQFSSDVRLAPFPFASFACFAGSLLRCLCPCSRYSCSFVKFASKQIVPLRRLP